MTTATKSISQLKKAAKLANRTFHKNGPKCYKKGQGALLKVLHKAGGKMTSRQLIDKLGFDRKELKETVRKAEKNGYVTIKSADEKRLYNVTITAEGEKLAEKRCKAQSKVADELMSALSAEEQETLNKLTEKLIVQSKELGAHGKRNGGKKCCRKHHSHKHGRKCGCK